MTEQEMLQDHESRLRKLEESDIRQQIQLANIEKGNAEIKVMINDITREQRNTLNDFTSKMLTTITKNVNEDNKAKNENIVKDNDVKNKIKFYNTKQFWIAITTLIGIVSSVITYLLK